MPERRIRCALLTGMRWDWGAAMMLACRGVDWVTVAPAAMGLSEAPNPFALPEDEQADVVVFGSTFYEWLRGRRPELVDDVLQDLWRRADAVVGIDSGDDFTLTFPPRVLRQLRLVLKGQGVYRDRDLYNYVLGPVYDGGIWAEKLRPRRERYHSADLERVRLSIPCYILQLPGIQRTARKREATSAQTMGRRMSWFERCVRNVSDLGLLRAEPVLHRMSRKRVAQCVLRASHVQRIEVMHLLEGLSGRRGITGFPAVILGTRYGWDLPADARDAIVDSARAHMTGHLGRLRYLVDMHRHHVVVAPTGWGELTFRHGEALRAGAVLVCQDLSHVEILLPLRDRENAVFCRPDLSDLREKVIEVARDAELRDRISRAGRESYRSWAKDWRSHLKAGIETHLHDVVGASG